MIRSTLAACLLGCPGLLGFLGSTAVAQTAGTMAAGPAGRTVEPIVLPEPATFQPSAATRMSAAATAPHPARHSQTPTAWQQQPFQWGWFGAERYKPLKRGHSDYYNRPLLWSQRRW